MKKIGRNSPCPCGSGRKFKKCCLLTAQLQAERAKAKEPERHLTMVRSKVHKGNRFRALWNTVYPRPEAETFHEFLIELTKWTFGKKWWSHQLGANEDSEHVVLRWTRAFESGRDGADEDPEDPERLVTTPSGPAVALLTMAYDFYCLQARNKLPDSLVARLRNSKQFQSARYEIAVAAIMARAGFEVEFLDDKKVSQKHCEFIATHKSSGFKLGVEAKSRVRPGVLLARGEFAHDEDVRGLVDLLRKASKQTVNGLPLLIFLDVNLPPTPELAPESKPWVKDAMAAADNLDRRALDPESGKARYSLLVITNFGYHFGEADGVVDPTELAFVRPPPPRHEIPDDVVQEILRSARDYGRVPDEV